MLQSVLYRVGYTAFTFIANIILANVLEPAYFGKISLLIVNASIISLLTGFGADGIVLHLLVNKKWNIKQSFLFIWIVLGLQTILFLLMQGVFNYIYHTTLLSQVPTQYLLFELLYFLGLIVTEKYLVFYYSTNKDRLVNILLLSVSLFYIALLILFQLQSLISYLTALKLLSAVSLTQLILIISIFHFAIKPLQFEVVKWQEFTTVFRKSSIIMITNVIQLLAYRIDFWFVKLYHSDYALGLYAQANKLANLIWIIPNIISLLAIPKFNKLSKSDLSAFFRVVAVSNFILTFLTLIASQVLYQNILSKEYFQGISSFYLMLPGYFGWAMVIYFAAYFSWLGKFQYNLYASLACFLLIVLLDILLIPSYSINGAAISNTIVYLSILILYIFFYIKESNSSIFDFFILHKNDLLVFQKILR
jgi:O-antigen/teichoic acid export membrane protein